MAGPDAEPVPEAPPAQQQTSSPGGGGSVPPSPVQPGQAVAGGAGASNSPSKQDGSSKAAASAKASRSAAARGYAPLPFQLRRLFFSPSAGDVKMGGRLLRLAHRDPHVYVIDDFLSESEYDYFDALIDQSYGKFRASYTDDSAAGAQFVTESRTSAFISLRKGGDTKLRSVEGRAAELVGLTPEYVEPLQMVGYRRHDKFDLHHDMGTYNSETGEVEAVSPRRLVTFFVYLNNLPRGQGHTVFPMLGDGRGFSVQPKRLRAVLFCNVLESGEPDVRLLHRADPVKEEGYLKFGLNIWVTDKSLQALAFSTAGTVLCKDSARLGAAAGKRSILALIDPPCEACRGRDRRHLLRACDACDASFHIPCLPPDARPSRDGRWWTCVNCVGKKPPKGEFCEACDGGKSPHLMLLCEQCDRAWHTYCLNPPLRKVPRDAWTCPPCNDREEKKHLAALRALEKEQRALEAQREPACDGAACEGGEAAEDKGEILLCDTKGCPSEWHMGCLSPPLKRVPKGEWFCPPCAAGREAEAEAAAIAAAEEAERQRPKAVRGNEGLAAGGFVVLREPDAGNELPFTLARVEALEADGTRAMLKGIGQCRKSRTQGLRFRLAAAPARVCEVQAVAAQVPCQEETGGLTFTLLVSMDEVLAALE